MKPKLILCTVGTSISNGVASQSEILKKVTRWDDSLKDFEREIKERIRDTKDFTKLSAEINSLNRIGIGRGDKIVLLCSDNAPGRICAEAIKIVLSEKYDIPDPDIAIKHVADLQVYNAKRMREFGLKNFIKEVLKYLDNDNYRYSYEIVLNPTGGYKGVLPFLTILGMLYSKKIAYIFEFADELIWLPPLPFSFNLQLFQRVKPALEYVESKVAVSKEEFLSKIPNYSDSEEILFMSFTEPFDDNKITVSALAYCFLTMEEQKDKIMIHSSVKDDLEKMEAPDQLKIKRLFRHCIIPLWRVSHIEQWTEHTDLLVIRKDRTAERLAGFHEKGIFYITHIFTVHKEYERNLREKWKKNYSDKTKFSEWIREEEIGIDETDRDLLADERDLLLIDKQNLCNLNKSLKEDNESLQEKIDGITDEKTVLEQLNKDLQSEINLLKAENQTLKEQYSNIQTNKGFFTRLKNIFKRNRK
jgi:putative CRISPR-associated protein (TIGR02619 family)